MATRPEVENARTGKMREGRRWNEDSRDAVEREGVGWKKRRRVEEAERISEWIWR